MKYTQGVNGAVNLCTTPDDGPLGLKDVPYREKNTIFLYFVDRASRYNSLLMTNLTHFFYIFIYYNSLHVSRITVIIIRRSNCINTSSGMLSLCE
jgi:hypothetical protein